VAAADEDDEVLVALALVVFFFWPTGAPGLALGGSLVPAGALVVSFFASLAGALVSLLSLGGGVAEGAAAGCFEAVGGLAAGGGVTTFFGGGVTTLAGAFAGAFAGAGALAPFLPPRAALARPPKLIRLSSWAVSTPEIPLSLKRKGPRGMGAAKATLIDKHAKKRRTRRREKLVLAIMMMKINS